MLFNSFTFILLFFPVVLAISISLKGKGLIRWMTLASILFYSYAGQKWFVIPMLITTTLDFYLAIAIEKKRFNRKLLLYVSLTGNLGLLFLFKYAGLFAATSEYLFSHTGGGIHSPFGSFLSLGLPAGISFYTFQTMSYIIDVYREDCVAEKNFWKFACFVSFFPHLVAGPLTRHNQLIPQLDRIEETGISPRWHAGIYLFSIGLTKKILIADRIANVIDPLLLNVQNLDTVTSWLVAIGYSIQLYFDFSGYSDMAIGLGRLFNIELPQNFNSPYKSLNPSELWTRWHMTLSRWLRDYLYIPLGGNRCSPFRQNINLIITMALGGFWHGANWTFVGFGFYHGLLLVLYHQTRSTWDQAPVILQRATTYLLWTFGLVLFRSPSFGYFLAWVKTLSGANALIPFQWSTDIAVLFFFNLLGLVIVNAFPNASSIKNWDFVPRRRQFALGLATLASLIFMNYSSKFLYFQF